MFDYSSCNEKDLHEAVAAAVREIAESYFHPVTGDAEILLDEFNTSPEFLEGHRRGLNDAYAVLQGVADWYKDEVAQR